MAGVVLKFQSTPPRRGATRCSSDLRWVPQNFNPRPREGGRRCGIAGAVQGIAISIHAPARGGDRYDRAASLTAWYFNPRPREGGRLLWMSTRPTVLIFQSTPPRGGATFGFGPLTLTQKLFQSTPPRGGATKALDKLEEEMEFQSTPPRGGATKRGYRRTPMSNISIHAPARGGDTPRATSSTRTTNFNPRPREGGRRNLTGYIN